MLCFDSPTLVELRRIPVGWLLRCALISGLFIFGFTQELSAGGLGKGSVYFFDRYGSQKFSKEQKTCSLYTPFQPSSAKFDMHCWYRRYEKGNVRLDTVLSSSGQDSHWVRITLKDRWTDEGLEAALAAYGTGWKSATIDLPQILEIPLLFIKQVYLSKEGRIAWYNPLGRQLNLYSDDVVEKIKASRKQEKERRTTVPQF